VSHRRDMRAALHAAIDAALDAAEAELRLELEREHPAAVAPRSGPPRARPAPPTPWQTYAAELRALCDRVLRDADEQTARAFWELLIETAARHAVRASSRKPAA
jgi:hypothetical protein